MGWRREVLDLPEEDVVSQTDHERDEFELDPDAEVVALRLAAGASHAEAAMAIGRGPKWVQRRLAEDALFRQRIEDLKVARVTQASAGLGALLERAIEVVDRNLDAERPIDQLSAARLVLDRFRLFRSDAEMADQIEELKARVHELRGALDALRTERGGRR